MSALVEKLFDTKSCKGNGIEWLPSAEQHGAGLLVIDMGQHRNGGKKSSVTYLVAEFAHQFSGRAFHFAKVTEGTDKTSAAEDVFIASNGRSRQCSCAGYAYSRGKDKDGRTTCKHIEAVVALLENRWI